MVETGVTKRASVAIWLHSAPSIPIAIETPLAVDPDSWSLWKLSDLWGVFSRAPQLRPMTYDLRWLLNIEVLPVNYPICLFICRPRLDQFINLGSSNEKAIRCVNYFFRFINPSIPETGASWSSLQTMVLRKWDETFTKMSYMWF